MLTNKLIEFVDIYTKAYQDASYFTNFLRLIEGASPDIDKLLIQIAETGNNPTRLAPHAQEILKKFTNLRSALVDIRVTPLVLDIHNFKNKLTTLNAEWHESGSQLSDIIAQVEDFGRIYDDYVLDYSAPKAVQVVISANRLNDKLHGFDQALTLIKNTFNLSEDKIYDPSLSVFSILIDNQMNLDEFAEKVKSIYELYKLLAYYFDSVNAEDILIERIEYGSLWAKIAGCTAVIGLLSDLIRGAVLFVHKNYTNDGKLSQVSVKIDVLNQVLDLSAKIKAAGGDAKKLDEHIEQSAILIGRNLEILLGGTEKLSINNEPLIDLKKSIKLIDNVPLVRDQKTSD